ncbi:MAG: hypothetical protein ACI9O6_000214 [Glaciecola sp.]|jgi:hypothetical protein
MTEDAAVANIYIEIINNQNLLHRMFRGLFASARIYLGQRPNCHQYIFETELILHYNFPAEKLEELDKEGVIVVPFAGKKSKDHLVLRCASMDALPLNSLYAECLQSLLKKGFDEDKINELKQAFCPKKFARTIVGMFWLDMVIFAKSNTDYDKNWRD